LGTIALIIIASIIIGALVYSKRTKKQKIRARDCEFINCSINSEALKTLFADSVMRD